MSHEIGERGNFNEVIWLSSMHGKYVRRGRIDASYPVLVVPSDILYSLRWGFAQQVAGIRSWLVLWEMLRAWPSALIVEMGHVEHRS